MTANMRTPVVLPDLGTKSALRLSAWLVDLGDVVAAGDRVAEVLMPGFSIDVSASAAGTLTAIDKPVDTTVCPGDTLGWIEATGHEAEA